LWRISKQLFKFIDFFSENRAVDEIMWKNMVEPVRPQMTKKYRVYVLYAG